MGKALCFVLMFSICTGCNNSKEKKAQGVIKKFLKNGMSNPDTYEPLMFGTLDSVFENLDRNKDSNNRYPVFTKFKMIHEYKANDIFNKSQSKHQIFFLDTSITSVIQLIDSAYLKSLINN